MKRERIFLFFFFSSRRRHTRLQGDWSSDVCSSDLALDGKALKRGYERGKSHMPPVMVAAWAAQTRMALANVLAPNNNEAAAAMQLIELVQLKGCVVTADALHCHRAIAKAIVERGGDYVLAVKENQSALL